MIRQTPYLVEARIIIPYDFPNGRDGYVTFCLATNTISVLTSNGEYIQQCPLMLGYVTRDDGEASSLPFPKNTDLLGGTVLMLRKTKTSKPVVIGMVSERNGRFGLTEELQWLVRRTYDSDDDSLNGTRSGFQIQGRGLKGFIDMSAWSEAQDGGRIRFTAHNDSDAGSIELEADTLTMNSVFDRQDEVGQDYLMLVYRDHLLDVQGNGDWTFAGDWTVKADGDVQIDGTEIRIGENAQQWTLLGEDTVSLIEDFIGYTNDIATALSSAVITTPAGAGAFDPAFTAQMQVISGQLQALGAQVQLLLSQKVKVE